MEEQYPQDPTRAPSVNDGPAPPNAHLWLAELGAALKQLQDWHAAGDDVVKRFRDERSNTSSESRWNLFYANIATQQALLFGRPPQATVTRKHLDAGDDVARVAGEILQRVINSPASEEGDPYVMPLQNALEDRLLPGLGVGRIRYDPTFEDVPATPAETDPLTGVVLVEEIPAHKKKVDEQATASYVYWQDFCWSSGARTWEEVRWVGFRSLLSRQGMVKRFGEAHANAVPYKSKSPRDAAYITPGSPDPMARAEVWEIWDKETKRVYWLVEGCARILDVKDDPLRLSGFFPCPRPMAANLVTREYLPRPDFALAQDLYKQIDLLQTKISLLTDAISVRGMYDATNKELVELLEPNGNNRNRMFPVVNWAAFAEKGGMRGSVDWFPLEAITAAIDFLRNQLQALQAQLYDVTGMSDILRGAGAESGVTATAEGLKARFGSARLQALQDDFARFASDLARLRAEVIVNLFDADTIIMQSNILSSPDAELAQPAVDLLKSRYRTYRVTVRPESLSLVDFAQQNSARMGLLTGVSTFLSGMAPLVQAVPGAHKHILGLLRWAVASMPGASEAEAVIDKAIAEAETAAATPQPEQPPPPPDSKVQAQVLKNQGELQKIAAATEAKRVEGQIEVATKAEIERNQAQANVAETAAKARISQSMRAQERALRESPFPNPFDGGDNG